MSSNFHPPALIPAAGLGTRLRPITSYLSKPLLPLGNQPVIKLVIKEALRAGCEPVGVIVNPGDKDLKGYLAKNYPRKVKHVSQPEPLGLADALLKGYKILGLDGPVAMLLADNIILDAKGLQYIIENRRNDWLTFGTMQVNKNEAKFYGNSGGYQGQKVNESGEVVEEIISLQEKKNGDFSRGRDNWPTRRTVGRALLPPEFFSEASRMEPDPQTGELDDVPIYRRLLENKPATGILLPDKVYDMGQPERYLRLCAACFQQEKYFD